MAGRSDALARDDVLDREAIATDRELLNELGLSDSDAATFLGRSRQAIHQQLGPRTGGPDRSGYFKVSDILTLVSAARQLGRPVEDKAILRYARSTLAESEPEAIALLETLLGDKLLPVDARRASVMILILAGFADMQARFPGIGADLAKLVHDARDKDDPAEVIIISPTSTRARIAGSQLGVPPDRCFGNDFADHYLPTVIVYGEGDPGVYVLTESGKFNGSAPFARATVGENALSMLPDEIRPVVEARRSRPG